MRMSDLGAPWRYTQRGTGQTVLVNRDGDWLADVCNGRPEEAAALRAAPELAARCERQTAMLKEIIARYDDYHTDGEPGGREQWAALALAIERAALAEGESET